MSPVLPHVPPPAGSQVSQSVSILPFDKRSFFTAEGVVKPSSWLFGAQNSPCVFSVPSRERALPSAMFCSHIRDPGTTVKATCLPSGEI